MENFYHCKMCTGRGNQVAQLNLQISSEEIAKTVLRAYQENRIHWYVPEDLEDLEMLVVKDPIKARDEVIKTGPMKMPIE